MEQTLAGFLHAYDQKAWRPGYVDCCLALASWAIWLGYPDPAEHLRGRYDSEVGFRAIIAQSGGVPALVASCGRKINARPIVAPSIGCIGVIGSPLNITRQYGAIYDGTRWQVRFIEKTSPLVGKPLAMWEI